MMCRSALDVLFIVMYLVCGFGILPNHTFARPLSHFLTQHKRTKKVSVRNTAAESKTEDKIEARFYETEFGESLRMIALKLFAKSHFWEILWKYNKEQLSDIGGDDLLPEGTKLKYRVRVRRRVPKAPPIMIAPAPTKISKKKSNQKKLVSKKISKRKIASNGHDILIEELFEPENDRSNLFNLIAAILTAFLLLFVLLNLRHRRKNASNTR